MTPDALEFALSQYADGTLPSGERAAVDIVLAADPAARATVADYRRLDRLLADPPAVNWDRFAARLAAAVADPPAVAGRIGWWRPAAVAAAAVVAVTVGLARHGRPTAPARTAPESVAVVSGPAVEAAAGPAEATVSIGPSPALAARGGSGRYAEGVVGRPPTVVIAGSQAVPGDVRFR